MSGLYFGLAFVITFTTMLALGILFQEKIRSVLLKTLIIIIYFLVNVFYFAKFVNQLNEYNKFNNEVFTDDIKITVNGQKVNDNKKLFFETLKFDKFSWVNHPMTKNKYKVSVFTNQREYKFIIWDTHNQGVLIIRIDENGNEYVTNQNDNLKFYIK